MPVLTIAGMNITSKKLKSKLRKWMSIGCKTRQILSCSLFAQLKNWCMLGKNPLKKYNWMSKDEQILSYSISI